MLLYENNKYRKLTNNCQKKPGSNINLLYNNNNVFYSALLNIIRELKRALRILLETIVNYYKDNIINNIQWSTKVSSVSYFIL